MRKFSFLKLVMGLACLLVFATGCDNKDAEDFIRSAPPVDQQVLSDFHSQKPENIFNEGLINLRAGELQKATLLLEKFTQLYPFNAMGQFYLGQAYYRNNRFEEAITRFKRAYQIDNTNTAALFWTGKALLELDREQEAKNVLLTYILSEPKLQNRNKAAEEINSMADPVAGRYIINSVYLTNVPEDEYSFPEPKICFPSSTQEIFAVVRTLHAPSKTQIEANLLYVVSKNEKKKVATTAYWAEGSENIVFPFKKPHDGFLPGEYELEIFSDKEKNISITFYVF
jgi:tetratricopeptide (TPR) repeat protein